jgi:hypothetical protein
VIVDTPPAKFSYEATRFAKVLCNYLSDPGRFKLSFFVSFFVCAVERVYRVKAVADVDFLTRARLTNGQDVLFNVCFSRYFRGGL